MSLTGALAAAVPAQAQPVGRVVVVPHATRELTEAEQRAADLVEGGLMARRTRLVSMHEARDRMQALSRPPASPDNSDLDVLASEARAALEHVAFGRSAAAQRSVQEVLSRAERALESLNRETKTARHVLDACLALVRNALARDQRRDALAEAMRCRRLVPDVSPSEMLHPASVIGVLAEADDQLRRMRIGRLSVQSKPESGCAAYVNGRHLGVTPFRLERAAAGEYRVQVECNRNQGRVHIVQLGDNVVDLTVDADFDRALRSEERVALVYDGAQERERLIVAHASLVAKTVKADETVLVSVNGPDATVMRVSANEARVLARTSFAWLRIEETESSELGQALDALFQGRFESQSAPPASPPVAPERTGGDTRVEQVVPMEEPPVMAAESPPERAAPAAEAGTSMARTRKFRIAAGSLAAAGAGLLAVGIAYEMKMKRDDSELYRLADMRPRNLRAEAEIQDAYDRDAQLRWLGLGGSALMTAAVPLLRVDVRQGVPWWSYVLGAGGVGLAVLGGITLAKDGECRLTIGDMCYQAEKTEGRGALFIGAAAPLLAFPITHLIEWGVGSSESQARAYLTPGKSSLMLMVHKEIRPW